MLIARTPNLRWNFSEMISERDMSFTDEVIWFQGITHIGFWTTGNAQKETGQGWILGRRHKGHDELESDVINTDVRVVNELDVSFILSWNFHFPAEL